MIKASYTSTLRIFGGRNPRRVVVGGTASIDAGKNILLSSTPQNKTAVDIYIDRLRARERVKNRKPIEEQRQYRVKQNVIKAKALAFFSLKSNFYAFYSISFPQGLDDKKIISCFNVWRTRVSKVHGQFDYLRVSERQKNGTLHFHLLTDKFFPIRELNRYMAVTLGMPNYNGVDVQHVKNTKGLTLYLSKYMSKGEKMEGVHPYRCSRLVSALATCVYYDDEALPYLSDLVEKGVAGWKVMTTPESFVKVELFLYETDAGKTSALPSVYPILSDCNIKIAEAFRQRAKLLAA